MNIAVFTDFFLDVPGGIPTSITAQKKALEALRHKVTVFCPGLQPSDDPSIVVVPTMKWVKPFGCPIGKRSKKVERFALRKLAEMERPDVIHVHHEMMVSIAGIRAARVLNVPVVQTMHGREDVAVATAPQPLAFGFSSVAAWWHSATIAHDVVVKRDSVLARTRTACNMWGLMVNQANNANIVVVPSKHFAEKLKHYGMHRETAIISNGVEDALMDRDWKVREWKVSEPLRVLWSSRLSKAKRPLEFLQAVERVDFPILVNVFGDGDQEKTVRDYVVNHDLQKKVKFHGAVSPERIKKELQSHHLLVLASYGFDNQPMTMLEALAAGMPVMYCDPDMAEIVPKAGAVLTPNEHVDGMVFTLNDLALDPSRIEEMSRAMLARRKDALQSTQVGKLVKVYQKVVKAAK